MSVPINYIAGHEADHIKWDRCIENAANGLIFGRRMYLDIMTDRWNAVIIGDYEAVIPLPWRKNLLIPYYYKVPFIPQAGIFGSFDAAIYRQLRKCIFSRVKFGDLLLNYDNAAFAKHLRANQLTNMVLDLTPPYSDLLRNFSRDMERQVKKAAKHKMQYAHGHNVKHAVALFRKRYESRIQRVRPIDFERFTGLCLFLQQAGHVFIRKVSDPSGKMLAAGLFMIDGKRIYNMMNIAMPDSRARSANYYLFDQLIVEFAGSGLTLDFEGSEVPALRRFYSDFGGVNQPYFRYRKMI